MPCCAKPIIKGNGETDNKLRRCQLLLTIDIDVIALVALRCTTGINCVHDLLQFFGRKILHVSGYNTICNTVAS